MKSLKINAKNPSFITVYFQCGPLVKAMKLTVRAENITSIVGGGGGGAQCCSAQTYSVCSAVIEPQSPKPYDRGKKKNIIIIIIKYCVHMTLMYTVLV